MIQSLSILILVCQQLSQLTKTTVPEYKFKPLLAIFRLANVLYGNRLGSPGPRSELLQFSSLRDNKCHQIEYHQIQNIEGDLV